MATLIAQLWPDASQDPNSDLYDLLQLGHKSPWIDIEQLDARSSLIAAALAILLVAMAPEEFGVIEAAGLSEPHRWGIILPNSSRVSMLTYKAIVAVCYPELVLQEANHTNIGHFVPQRT